VSDSLTILCASVEVCNQPDCNQGVHHKLSMVFTPNIFPRIHPQLI
jgi:hypothetical protein